MSLMQVEGAVFRCYEQVGADITDRPGMAAMLQSWFSDPNLLRVSDAHVGPSGVALVRIDGKPKVLIEPRLTSHEGFIECEYALGEILARLTLEQENVTPHPTLIRSVVLGLIATIPAMQALDAEEIKFIEMARHFCLSVHDMVARVLQLAMSVDTEGPLDPRPLSKADSASRIRVCRAS